MHNKTNPTFRNYFTSKKHWGKLRNNFSRYFFVNYEKKNDFLTANKRMRSS